MQLPDRISSGRDLARRLGLSHTAIQKAEQIGRIHRDADGSWNIERVRRDLMASAVPGRSPMAAPGDGSPLDRLTLARLALGVEAQRLSMDEKKGRLMDVTVANHRIDEAAAGMRDAVLNWPARVAGQIAAEIGRDPHLVQTILQEQMNVLLLEVADRLDPAE
jgi:hypothetical protein